MASFCQKGEDLAKFSHSNITLDSSTIANGNDTVLKSAKGMKVLQALATSILPIISSSPLWTLPTTSTEATRMRFNLAELPHPGDSRENDILRSFFQTSSSDLISVHGNFQRSLYIGEETKNVFEPEIIAPALGSNAIVLGYLMDIVGNVSRLLGMDMASFLPTILFPILEKTSTSANHHHVQQCAVKTLGQIAQATGAASVSLLIYKNLDYLLESMSSKLYGLGGLPYRRRAKQEFPVSLPGVLELLLSSATKEIKLGHSISAKGKMKMKSRIIFLQDVVNSLVTHFDSILSTSVDYGQTELATMLGMAESFNASAKFLLSIVRSLHHIEHDPPKLTTEHNGKPWMDILVQFHQGAQEDSRGDEIGLPDRLSAKEGFKRHHSLKDACYDKVEEVANSSVTMTNNTSDADVEYITGNISVVNEIISRCCFFISTEDLRIQVSSCKALEASLDFLAYAQNVKVRNAFEYVLTHHLSFLLNNSSSLADTIIFSTSFSQATESDSDVVSNPLLVAINYCWPSISTRLRLTADAITTSHSSCKLHFEIGKSKPVLSSAEIIFKDLLGIITKLCELSGEFMASRFMDETWPVLANLLGLHLRDKSLTGCVDNNFSSRRYIGENAQASGNNTVLLAIFFCFSRISGVTKLG